MWLTVNTVGFFQRFSLIFDTKSSLNVKLIYATYGAMALQRPKVADRQQ